MEDLLPPETEQIEAKETKKSAPVSKIKGKKKKTAKQISDGCVFIQATYNNTVVTLTDKNGNVLGWSSAGLVGFTGPKKATPYAATKIVKDAVDKVKNYGLKNVAVFVKGVGAGRDSAIRALNANNLQITSIKDVTPIPHNGCKKPRRRRI